MNIRVQSVSDFRCPKTGRVLKFQYREVEEEPGIWLPSPQCGCDSQDGSDTCQRCTADFFKARFAAYQEQKSQHLKP